MAKAKWCGPEIYKVASRLVEHCLRRDGSLFSSERAVWTLDVAQALDGRVGAPIKGTGSFVEKLERQLEGLGGDEVQLAAEVFFVQLLAESDTSGDTKAEQVNRVLAVALATSPMPDELVKALHAGGVAKYGAGKSWRDAYMRFLVRFLVAWKELAPEEVERRLASPWEFRDFVNGLRSSTDALQANALLHLIFPDTFQYMIAPSHRQRLTAAFAKAPGVQEVHDDDEDRQIEAIRSAATKALGRELELYSEPFHRVWSEDPTPQWTEMVSWAKRIFERDDFDRNERDYKLALADKLGGAREAIDTGAPDWLERLRAAFKDSKNNLTDWRVHDKFLAWCESDVGAARDAVALLWQNGDADARLAQFLAALPREAVSGPGTRLSIASFLLLGSNPTDAAFFKPTPYGRLRRALGLPERAQLDLDPDAVFLPNELAAKLGVDGRRVREFLRENYPREEEQRGADWLLTFEQAQSVVDHFGEDEADSTVATYTDWVHLLEELLLRLLGEGVRLRDLLDAQGIVWLVLVAPPPEDWSEGDRRALELFRRGGTAKSEKPPTTRGKVVIPAATAALAADLHLPQEWLQNIIDLLEEKRQLIFYGPPGTGKTFVARRIGRHLAESGGYMRLVQFHPSYTYEDFFEGYRPVSSRNGQLEFRLVYGPLREIAQRAREHPGEPHLLIVDEINRGNVAKVFGELYFLLEYRNERIELQYSRDEQFELPDNLYFIGTMNTADRSIALVDSALRRRFSFVGFVPRHEPVKSVLRKWLEGHELDPEPAALLDELNEAIGEDDFSIGPSYFMTRDGTAPRLAQVWEHALKPLLEEHYYGTNRAIEAEFGFPSLRKRLAEEADALAVPSEPDPNEPAN